MDHRFHRGDGACAGLQLRLARRRNRYPPARRWVLLFGTFAIAAMRSEVDRQRSESLLVELEDTHRKLQEYAVQAEELAAVEERNRLARELHDSVTQTIFSMTLAAESSRILAERDPSKVDAELERLQDLAKGALAEMRALIHQLRPTSVNERGLILTLQDYVETVRRWRRTSRFWTISPPSPSMA